MQCDGLQIEPAVEIDGGDNVLEGGDDALNSCDMLLFGHSIEVQE